MSSRPVPAPPAVAVADHPSAGPRDRVLDRLLSKQPLHDLSLVGADLREIDFQGASLARLDLRRANLQGAGFRGVDAAEIQLESADLTGASFEGADLTRANLSLPQPCFDLDARDLGRDGHRPGPHPQ